MSSQPAIRQIAHGTKETGVPPQMLFLPCSPVPTFALFFFIAEAFIYDFSLSATGMQSLCRVSLTTVSLVPGLTAAHSWHATGVFI